MPIQLRAEQQLVVYVALALDDPAAGDAGGDLLERGWGDMIAAGGADRGLAAADRGREDIAARLLPLLP